MTNLKFFIVLFVLATAVTFAQADPLKPVTNLEEIQGAWRRVSFRCVDPNAEPQLIGDITDQKRYLIISEKTIAESEYAGREGCKTMTGDAAFAVTATEPVLQIFSAPVAESLCRGFSISRGSLQLVTSYYRQNEFLVERVEKAISTRPNIQKKVPYEVNACPKGQVEEWIWVPYEVG